MTLNLDRVRKALTKTVAGTPGELDPAVPPGGATHDTDVEIADDVVKLVDVNSPNTPNLETRAYESGTDDDGSADTPPYDGKSSVDGVPTIPDTLAATRRTKADSDPGSKQKNKGGGGPVVQLPDTLEDELSVAPKDPHSSSAALTTTDVADLRQLMSTKADANVAKAVNALVWLDKNSAHPQHKQVKAGLEAWKPTRAQASEAQARYGFAYLHTQASAAPQNAEQTKSVLSWLKGYLTGRKLRIAAEFLKDTKKVIANPELASQILTWYETTAVDQVTENDSTPGYDEITLYGPQNGAPDHRPGGFEEPKTVSLHDVPFKDPSRHPAEAETDDQTACPSDSPSFVDSDSFKAQKADRAKESNLPTASKKSVKAMPGALPGAPMGMGCGEEMAQPPMPGAPGEAPMPPMPPMPGQDPAAGPGALPPLPELPPTVEEDPAQSGMGAPGAPGAMPPMPGAPAPKPMAPAAPEGGDMGMDMGLEEWLQQEMGEPQHMGQQPAESTHVEMLSSFESVGQIVAADVHMVLHGSDQENPHWNIDIKGTPIARVELKDQPNPEAVRATFLSGHYYESIAKAMEAVSVVEVLTSIKAKPYVAKIEAGSLAKKIEARVRAAMELEYAAKVGELRERLMAATKLSLAGFNSNFFKDKDNVLKAALWSELRALGVRDASRAIEAGFAEAAVPFFAEVLAKAEELMDMPDEARDVIAKAIPQCNSLVSASADEDVLPAHDSLAHRLEAANVPFDGAQFGGTTVASRQDLRGEIRERIRLSNYRSS